MDSETRSFNESHFLGHLLKDNVVAHGLLTRSEEIDLRFLNMIGMGDTYDGDVNPSDGVAYRAVLYGNQIAWEQWAQYVMGSCEQRSDSGNGLYRSMYFVARLYLKIQAVARALYFHEGIELEEGTDSFYMSVDDLEILHKHPQFIEMVDVFGLVLEAVEGKDKNGYKKVTVTKFYKEEAVSE